MAFTAFGAASNMEAAAGGLRLEGFGAKPGDALFRIITTVKPRRSRAAGAAFPRFAVLEIGAEGVKQLATLRMAASLAAPALLDKITASCGAGLSVRWTDSLSCADMDAADIQILVSFPVHAEAAGATAVRQAKPKAHRVSPVALETVSLSPGHFNLCGLLSVDGAVDGYETADIPWSSVPGLDQATGSGRPPRASGRRADFPFHCPD